MNPALLTPAHRGLIFRLLVNSNKIVQQRGYASVDDETFYEHQKLPKNYKSFAGSCNPDHPAFNYWSSLRKQVDPNRKIPEWSYRMNFDETEPIWWLENMVYKGLSATFWGWMIWRLYWGGYNVLLGEPEFTVGPDTSKWTDAELGIPDDEELPPRIYDGKSVNKHNALTPWFRTHAL